MPAALFLGGDLLLGTRAYASYIEPHRLQVRTVRVTIPGLRQPLRILHISDIQSAGIGQYEATAFCRMRELHPDLVLHTGDMLQPLPPATYASETPRLAALFRTLTPPLGCYGVAGDVDYSLLGHSPDFALAAQDLPIDLCLAGHTHGGQIRGPWYGPILTLTKHVPREWARGFHVIGKTRLNVSAGIGSEHAAGLPAIRVNCPPEMTLLLLAPGT